MGNKVYTEIEGIKVKKVPTVTTITYEETMSEAVNNKQNLENSIVDLIFHYFKNK